MRKVLRHRPSPAMIVACIALTIALSGASYAAVVLPKNSVGTTQLKKNAVNSSKVKNRSLLAQDFAAGQLPAGAQGPTGAQGLTGPQGPPGANGVADAFARVQLNGTLQPNVAGLPPQAKGIDAGDVVKGDAGVATGNYCFGNLGFRVASAVVSLDNADAGANDRNLVASVAIERGEDLGDCPATHNQARVRIVDGSTGAAQDARFFIWFEG